mgnify:CR=1 FL=1
MTKTLRKKNWSRGLISPLMKRGEILRFWTSFGSQRLSLHKLDTLAKTINSNSQPTTTSQTVNTRRLKSSSRFSSPTTPLTKTNLNLIAKNVAIVANTTFKTIDYTYLKKNKVGLIAYVQATFEVGGTTHSENFTFTLSEKDKSYYVTKLEHTIPLNYANDKD